MQIRSAYEASIYEARMHYLQLDAIVQERIAGVMVAARDEINTMMNQYAVKYGDAFTRARLGALQDQLDTLSRNIAIDVTEITENSALTGAKIATTGKLEAGRVLFKGHGAEMPNDVVAMFSTVPEDAVRATMTREIKGRTFSDRIWLFEQNTKSQISDIVTSGVAQGKSPREIAKLIEPHLQPDRASWLRWQKETDELFKGTRKRRSRISYEAKRLARTETANAYREASVMSAQAAPWVKGLKWVLSGSHRIRDICDVWATQNKFGLGAGVYPPAELPVDHPNGLCYPLDVLPESGELGRLLDRYAEAA